MKFAKHLITLTINNVHINMVYTLYTLYTIYSVGYNVNHINISLHYELLILLDVWKTSFLILLFNLFTCRRHCIFT